MIITLLVCSLEIGYCVRRTISISPRHVILNHAYEISSGSPTYSISFYQPDLIGYSNNGVISYLY